MEIRSVVAVTCGSGVDVQNYALKYGKRTCIRLTVVSSGEFGSGFQ